MTLAPRSWPSSPGLAISTRSGGMSLWLQQLDQHAERGRRLQKRDVAMCPGARLVVDQRHTFVLKIAQVLADIGCPKAQMVKTGAATLQKPRYRTVRVSRLEKLDQQVGGLDHRDLQLSVGQVNRVDHAQAEFVAIEMHGVIDARHRHPDVMHRQWASVLLNRAVRRAKWVLGLPKRAVRRAKWVHAYE